jgi:hypothetical protein
MQLILVDVAGMVKQHGSMHQDPMCFYWAVASISRLSETSFTHLRNMFNGRDI